MRDVPNDRIGELASRSNDTRRNHVVETIMDSLSSLEGKENGAKASPRTKEVVGGEFTERSAADDEPESASDGKSVPGGGDQYTVLLVAACPFPANNGTSSRILRMGESLVERGHDVHVASYHLQDEDIPVTEGPTIHRVHPSFSYRKTDPGPSHKKPLIDALLLKKVMQICRAESIDVIHGHHIEGLACSLPAATIYDIPIIYDAHTHVTSELKEYYEVTRFGPVNDALELVEKALIRRASGVISVSAKLRDILRSYGVEGNDVWVVPTGINARTVQQLAVESTLTRTDLGLDEYQPVIVFTGALKPFQGLRNLFDAMQYVSERHPGARLLLVGGGDVGRYSAMAERFGVSDSVLFCGEVPFVEVPGYLSLADVGVLPRTEATGMPQKLTNYLAVGLPVVAFEGSGKALSHLENGLLVEDEDVVSFASSISTLIEDGELCERMSEQGRRSVSDYEWSSLVRTVEEAYSQVVGQVVPVEKK